MKTHLPKLIIISGPTASGKTSTSIRVAKYIQNKIKQQTTIINFDSLLFYKELNIGTAKPSTKEMDGIEHLLLNNRSISEPLNASEYSSIAMGTIAKLKDQSKVVILVGGSGFYLRALIKGMYDSPSIDINLREQIQKEYQTKGIGFIRDFLKENDLESFNSLHANDHYRNIRAYEHFKSCNSPLSLERKKSNESKPYDFSDSLFNDWDILHFYLDIEKSTHFEIITKRTEQMINDGLIEEVTQILQDPNFTGAEKPLSSIGYKETMQYLNNQFDSKEEYVKRISISTRQLAKSQRTFFNKVTPKHQINPLTDQDKIIHLIDNLFKAPKDH